MLEPRLAILLVSRKPKCHPATLSLPTAAKIRTCDVRNSAVTESMVLPFRQLPLHFFTIKRVGNEAMKKFK